MMFHPRTRGKVSPSFVSEDLQIESYECTIYVAVLRWVRTHRGFGHDPFRPEKTVDFGPPPLSTRTVSHRREGPGPPDLPPSFEE